jgi:FkbM family methyltransferase
MWGRTLAITPYSLPGSLARQAGVYAFEPEPENYALLVKNVEVNGYRNVVCLQQAVSNTSGEAELFAGWYDTHHSLCRFAGVDSTRSIKVEATSLDEFFQKQEWPPIDFIKMDIEGWEPFALEGMTELLRRSKHLKMILEFCSDLVRQLGVEPAAFLKRLQDAGFSIRVMDEVKGPQPLDVPRLLRIGTNLLCERA